MTRWLTTLLSLVFLTSLSAPLYSQALTPEEHERIGVDKMRKAQARQLFFQNRYMPIDGSIPQGAKLQAWRKAQQALDAPRLAKGTAFETREWVNVGPFNIGGRLKTVAVNPMNPSTIFVGAAGGGIWRSYDAAQSWHPVSDNLPTQSMGNLVINPVDTSIIYAGTGEASFGGRSFDGAGIFKSTDGGTTWTEVSGNGIPEYSRVGMMAINPVNPDIVYAAIPGGARDQEDFGIYRTTDAGGSWEKVFDGRTTDVILNPQNPDILYTVSSKIFGGTILGQYGMYKSIDGGETWNKLDLGIVDSTMGRTGLALCAAQPDVVYASVSEVTGDGRTPLLGIYKTTDGGASWAKKEVPFDYMISQGWFDNVMGVHPANPDIVYAGGVKMIRSSDGGENWERIKDQLGGGLLHVDQHAIAFNPQNPDEVWVGNDGGLFRLTDDGQTLDKMDIGMSITQFIGGDMHPADDRFLFGGTQDNGTMRSPQGNAFELTLYGDGGYGWVHPERPNIMWTTQESGKMFLSEDHGVTWYRVIGDLDPDQSLFYTPYVMDKTNPNTLYWASYRVWKTENSGRNWDRLQSGLFPTPTGSFYFISTLTLAAYDPDIVLAGATAGGGIAISTNGGADWLLRHDAIPEGYVTSVRSFEQDELYATISTFGVDKVWHSTDLGISWQNINGNLPDIPVTDIFVRDGIIVIGTDLGVFVSEDDGTSWLLMENGMPTVPIERLYFNERTGVLRAYTHGRGMYDLQWDQPTARAPQFLSQPDTTILEFGEVFTYAPVVDAHPAPTFTLVDAPSVATIDPVLGTVRWSGSDLVADFTVEATNSEGTARQVFRLVTNDAPTNEWQVVSPERMSTAVNMMRHAGESTLWVARDSGMVSRSTDGGRSWEHHRVMERDIGVVGLYAFDENRAIVGTGGSQSLVNTGEGFLLRTTDGGSSWEHLLYGVDSRFGNIHFWNDLEGIVVSQGAQDSADVWLTSDGGDTWVKQVEREHSPIPLYNTLRFIDRDRGWYASKLRDDFMKVLRTNDGGVTWSDRDVRGRFASELAMLNEDRGFFVDEFTGEVFRTVQGVVWSSINAPMVEKRNASVDADIQAKMLWIVNDSTAWVSRNEGDDWTATTLVNTGPIQDAVFPDSIRGWAISKTGVVQSLIRNPVVSVERVTSAIAGNLELLPAYPNPAAGETVRIPFRLSSASNVEAAIYNTSGKKLHALGSSRKSAGQHAFDWATEDLAPGTYFYTITTGNASATGRIVITK